MATDSSEGIGLEGEAVGLAMYVGEHLDCFENSNGDDKVECLWVKNREKTHEVDVLVVICYRPPNQAEEADKIFYKQAGRSLPFNSPYSHRGLQLTTYLLEI